MLCSFSALSPGRKGYKPIGEGGRRCAVLGGLPVRSAVEPTKGAVMSRMGDTANAGNVGEQNQGNQGGGQGIMGQVQQMGDTIRDKGQQAREAATQSYQQLRDQAQDYYQQGRDKAQEWEQSLEQYVHEKPLQAVLIAAGVGVMLGLLWKRS